MISTDQIRAALPLALGETRLPLNERCSGKVRDWYSLEGGKKLFVTTDRLSAFDRILARVPYKGQVLNQLSAWWFDVTRDLIDNQMIAVPDPNAVVARSVRRFPVEIVVRGYITGVTATALWYRYSLGEREIYGYRFPDGLKKNQSLPEPILTPTTKGEAGAHDERLTNAEVVERGLLDAAAWEQVSAAALAVFRRGQEVAAKAGLILVDTKYEMGLSPEGKVMLIDEVHTPDSSRFWKAESYAERFAAGEEPENYDKELVRLAYAEQGYRGEGEPPVLPDEVWVAASQRYISIFEMLTGQDFEPAPYPAEPRIIENLKRAGIL
ncbi:MAG: phosphoribosylaminoimidazolesuccinocarboxamide synthase [Anaerolineales bacterium]|nr:phosphoribosylaminoimidazolesuccinocarboxamide synthase [Anaerolineales bacterium]